jgi:4-aminobutyrate aminotransferase-like enzyme/Ser/Thr protein kinase RdoA (MazF antagonist)
MSSIVTQAPRFSDADAAVFAKELFGVSGVFRQLPSERDQNFHVLSEDRKNYILKIANAAEEREALEFQNQAMTHVFQHKDSFTGAAGVCPEIINNKEGDTIATVSGADGIHHYVRMLSYLPGKPLGTTTPHNADLLKSLGNFFGNLDAALTGFDHPAAHRRFHWDLKEAPGVIDELVHAIQNKEKQGMIRVYLKGYLGRSHPKLNQLRQSVIHNDGNDYNVLVAPDTPWQNRVDSVIDYGDMVYTHTINELAIVCAYAMMGKLDPLMAAKHVVTGYHQVNPLQEIELAILFDLICMRLCMSVCHAAHQSQMAPDNEYLQISQKPAWHLLKQLRSTHPRFAEYVFRDACDLPPVPQSHKIAAWLKQNRKQFEPITHPDPAESSVIILDLGVESPLINAADMGVFSQDLTRVIFGHMRKHGARIGIGRYDEARSIYLSDAYRQMSDQMPEMRTIHMGMDIHLEPGTAIHAFYDGKIHSFQNNASPLDYGPTIILSHETDAGTTFYTLYGHLSLQSLQGLSNGKPVAAGEKIAEIGESAVNGGWPPHLHFQIITDMLGETGNYNGVAPPSQRRIWKALSPDPNMILGMPKTEIQTKARSRQDILKVRSRHIGRNFSIAYKEPLKFVRGRGQYLIDQDGQAYLDGVNNVTHVGHCHPEVVAAGQRQMTILNTNTRYLHDHIITYTEKILATFPKPLSVCFFVCTGSEANELAFRMAKNYTGQEDIVTVAGAYHGNTNLLIDISPYKHGGPGGRGAPAWVQTVAMPDGYRGPYKGQGLETGAAYADDVKNAIARIESQHRGVAAFICESLLGCGGQIVLPDNYLKSAFQHVRNAGGVCIADEVQVGFGRVGSHFWAFEMQGVVPDIVTLGKPIGNGHPMALVVTTPEIAEAFHNGMEYFNTYGGNPVSCAIGKAVLDVIEKEQLQQNAHIVGKRLLQGFRKLKQSYPLIGDVRGQGLFIGIELVKNRKTLEPAAEEANYIINRFRDYGILISTDGPLHNVLKLKPPMVFSEQNADEIVSVLEKILAEDCLCRLS